MYRTTLPKLLAAYRFFEQCPDGQIRTGMWEQPTWTADEFRGWFRGCLHAKINRNDRRPWRKLDDAYQLSLAIDARTVNDYYARRMRHTGCRNILRTPELRRRYPHVNSQPRLVD
jgi:hypothetical protein